MNKTKTFLFGTAVVLALLCIFLWKSFNLPKNTSQEMGQMLSVTSTAPQAEAQTSSHITRPSLNKSVKAISSNVTTNSFVSSNQAAVMGEINVPIEFWGKVVDQSGSALANVLIQTTVRHWERAPDAGVSVMMLEGEVSSGPDGQFHVSGMSGDDLTLKITKDGYELEPNAKIDFGFNTSEKFSPQSNSPAIFRMWATNFHEQLIAGKRSFHIVPDGRSYFVDLIHGTISEFGQGDLKVSIKLAPQSGGGGTNDWSSQIDVVKGGLLEESDMTSSMYAAPADGYTPTFHFDQKIANGKRGSIGERRFYLSLLNGQEFGRVSFQMFAPYSPDIPGLISVDYAVNPSGSRLLR